MFAAFALSPSAGGIRPSPPAAAPSSAQQPPAAAPPQAAAVPPPPAPPTQQQQQPDPERDAWAAAIYQRLAGSPSTALALDPKHPTVPVILHPSAPRGGTAPPVTARHLGFLRVDLTGESAGPGRFFPLFPADAAEEEVGVDTGSLDRFGCSGHWASSGCIRLLTAAGEGGCAPAAGADGKAAEQAAGGSSSGSQGRDAGRDDAGAAAEGQPSGLALMPLPAFAALWERSRPSSAAGGAGSGGGKGDGSAGASLGSGDGGWHVPYSRLLPLEEAYGGLARELKSAGLDLSRAHYMLRGWKTKEGRPRLSDTGPRAPPAASAAQRPRRGVVPAELAATRDQRALINWPGLLELLEEEGVAVVPTDGVRYWLARLGGGFHARLAAAGVLCSEATVHHIIARSARGIDHPLNYFMVDRGPNSAMGSRVEGFRDASGTKLHMRDVVGEKAFEVAQAACNLYHGVLYSGRQRGAPLKESLKELREGAFALAEEAIAVRQAREARRQARNGGSAVNGSGGSAAAGTGSPAAGSPGAEAPAAAAWQQEQQHGSQPRSLKRERCPGSAEQRTGGSSENEPLNAALLSPTQQQQERRRRLSGEVDLAAVLPVASPADALAAAAYATPPPVAAAAACEGDEEAEAGMAALSLHCSPEGPALQAAPSGLQVQEHQSEQEEQEQQQGGQRSLTDGMVAADFSSLRARLRAALGVTG
ncbi:hypothetical protein ABPG75_011069 [Micractinium tetrahymenae]